MKRWIVVGLEGSGKSTICDLIEGESHSRKKTQDLFYRPKTLEVPAAYLENAWMNNIIIMLAQNQGKANIFILDGSKLESMYSPRYAKAFTKPSLALVTKADLMDQKDRVKALKIMEDLECDQVVFYSDLTKEGLADLQEWLEKTK